MYDVQDPEPDESGNRKLHAGSAREIVPIPPVDAILPNYPNGTNVFAKYPETDTFYRAKVRGLSQGQGLYTLQFEGEDDAKDAKTVDKRYVIDTRMR